MDKEEKTYTWLNNLEVLAGGGIKLPERSDTEGVQQFKFLWIFNKVAGVSFVITIILFSVKSTFFLLPVLRVVSLTFLLYAMPVYTIRLIKFYIRDYEKNGGDSQTVIGMHVFVGVLFNILFVSFLFLMLIKSQKNPAVTGLFVLFSCFVILFAALTVLVEQVDLKNIHKKKNEK